MKLSGNKILITGGATGIGSGLTQRFIQEHNTVIICGRRESALKEAAKKFPSVITRVCDLSIAGERESLFNWIAKEHKTWGCWSIMREYSNGCQSLIKIFFNVRGTR